MLGSNVIITFDASGESNQASTPEEVVKQKLLFLLTTNKGELPNNLEYGADLIHFVHGNKGDVMDAALENTIRMEVALEMPYVRITRLQINESEQGILDFTLFYSLPNNIEDYLDVNIAA